MSKPGSRRGTATAAFSGALIAGALLTALAALATGGAAASDAAPTNSSLPTIGGEPVSGQTLKASPGTWSGTTPITYAYQWQRCPSNGACATSRTRRTRAISWTPRTSAAPSESS